MQVTEDLLSSPWVAGETLCFLVACPQGFPRLQFSLLFLYSTSFLFVIEHMMPLCMVISWVYSVAMMIQHIVTEKEHRLKEVGMVGEIPGDEQIVFHACLPRAAQAQKLVPSCALLPSCPLCHPIAVPRQQQPRALSDKGRALQPSGVCC